MKQEDKKIFIIQGMKNDKSEPSDEKRNQRGKEYQLNPDFDRKTNQTSINFFLKETQLATKPYLKYQDKEGNIIREYKFFQSMNPTQKDIHGYYNFFDNQALKNKLEQIGLDNYYLQWTNGQENLYHLEKDSNGKVKKKYGWKVSKANFQIIHTNKPNNITELLTKDRDGENDFYNESICFLNSCRNRDFYTFKYLRGPNYPYIRLMTKNLELEFDWIRFIFKNFEYYLSDNQKDNYNLLNLFSNKKDDSNTMKSQLKPKEEKDLEIKFERIKLKNNTYRTYFNTSKFEIIKWLNNLNLTNEQEIKLKQWAIYNMEKENQQLEPPLSTKNSKEIK